MPHLTDMHGNRAATEGEAWAALYARLEAYYAREPDHAEPFQPETIRIRCAFPECTLTAIGGGHWCWRHRYVPRALREAEAAAS